jgi:hypothetical protein
MRGHKIATTILLAVFDLVCIAPRAGAWGPEGHALVGKIADQLLLGTYAGQQVKARLRLYTLAEAAKWADCVKSVHKEASGSFKFVPDKYTEPCTAFYKGRPGEKARMVDYVRRNWDTFPNEGKPDHSTYHFADIPIEHGTYSATDIGANDHDVVHAINAALAKLSGNPVPAPFSIKDDKEAILLLAHFVGDIHQPLHVGAIYLDPQGQQTDPHTEDEAKAATTAGGNFIEVGTDNLHAEWDEIPKALEKADIRVLVAQAKAVPPSSTASKGDWAIIWASESVTSARAAYEPITYTGDGDHKWKAVFDDHQKYLRDEADEKRTRIVQAGARLAAIFKTIWPSTGHGNRRKPASVR